MGINLFETYIYVVNNCCHLNEPRRRRCFGFKGEFIHFKQRIIFLRTEGLKCHLVTYGDKIHGYYSIINYYIIIYSIYFII